MSDELAIEDRNALLAGNMARLYRLPGYENGITADGVRVVRAARAYLRRPFTAHAGGGFDGRQWRNDHGRTIGDP